MKNITRYHWYVRSDDARSAGPCCIYKSCFAGYHITQLFSLWVLDKRNSNWEDSYRWHYTDVVWKILRAYYSVLAKRFSTSREYRLPKQNQVWWAYPALRSNEKVNWRYHCWRQRSPYRTQAWSAQIVTLIKIITEISKPWCDGGIRRMCAARQCACTKYMPRQINFFAMISMEDVYRTTSCWRVHCKCIISAQSSLREAAVGSPENRPFTASMIIVWTVRPPMECLLQSIVTGNETNAFYPLDGRSGRQRSALLRYWPFTTFMIIVWTCASGHQWNALRPHIAVAGRVLWLITKHSKLVLCPGNKRMTFEPFMIGKEIWDVPVMNHHLLPMCMPDREKEGIRWDAI
jgi:hypothetical protein